MTGVKSFDVVVPPHSEGFRSLPVCESGGVTPLLHFGRSRARPRDEKVRRRSLGAAQRSMQRDRSDPQPGGRGGERQQVEGQRHQGVSNESS